jgi:hypothetical protein
MKNYILIIGLFLISFTSQSQKTTWVLSHSISSNTSKENYKQHNEMLLKISADSIGFFGAKKLLTNQNYVFSYKTKNSNLIIKDNESNTQGLGYYINDSIFEYSTFARRMIFHKVKQSRILTDKNEVRKLIKNNYYTFFNWEREKADTITFISNNKTGPIRNLSYEIIKVNNSLFFTIYGKILPLKMIDKKKMILGVYNKNREDLLFQKVKLSKNELKGLSEKMNTVAIEYQ